MRFRLAEDRSPEVAKGRQGDRVESGLRLRHLGNGYWGGAVLALPGTREGSRREHGGFRKGLLLQGAPLSRFRGFGAAFGRGASGGERGASVSSAGSDPSGAISRGGAAPSASEGATGGSGLAHPGGQTNCLSLEFLDQGWRTWAAGMPPASSDPVSHTCLAASTSVWLLVCPPAAEWGLPFRFSHPFKTYARFIECIAENATRSGSRFCTKRIVRPLREPCSCARRPGR